MGEGLVKGKVERGVLPLKASSGGVEVGLDFRVGRRAKQHKLAATVQCAPGCVFDQMHPLLRCQPADNAHQGLVLGLPTREVQSPAKLLLGGPLPLNNVGGVVVQGQEHVCLWVPDVRVDAVADATQLHVVCSDCGVAPNLKCIRGGHCCELLAIKRSLGNTALPVVHVVDCENHLWLPEAKVMVVRPVELCCHGCRPVVGVDDVRLTGSLQQELQRGLAEEIETHSIVVPAINRADIKHAILGLDEEALNAFHLALGDIVLGAAPVKLSVVLEVLEQRAVVEECILW
mmetsp:Transcript_20070/g.55736  ORF Transcript_20070/g.55736 Transcript_20070/m.55736 type:complete len:288 (-) Transcript_20070:2217-3080(-)